MVDITIDRPILLDNRTQVLKMTAHRYFFCTTSKFYLILLPTCYISSHHFVSNPSFINIYVYQLVICITISSHQFASNPFKYISFLHTILDACRDILMKCWFWNVSWTCMCVLLWTFRWTGLGSRWLSANNITCKISLCSSLSQILYVLLTNNLEMRRRPWVQAIRGNTFWKSTIKR